MRVKTMKKGAILLAFCCLLGLSPSLRASQYAEPAKTGVVTTVISDLPATGLVAVEIAAIGKLIFEVATRQQGALDTLASMSPVYKNAILSGAHYAVGEGAITAANEQLQGKSPQERLLYNSIASALLLTMGYLPLTYESVATAAQAGGISATTTTMSTIYELISKKEPASKDFALKSPEERAAEVAEKMGQELSFYNLILQPYLSALGIISLGTFALTSASTSMILQKALYQNAYSIAQEAFKLAKDVFKQPITASQQIITPLKEVVYKDTQIPDDIKNELKNNFRSVINSTYTSNQLLANLNKFGIEALINLKTERGITITSAGISELFIELYNESEPNIFHAKIDDFISQNLDRLELDKKSIIHAINNLANPSITPLLIQPVILYVLNKQNNQMDNLSISDACYIYLLTKAQIGKNRKLAFALKEAAMQIPPTRSISNIFYNELNSLIKSTTTWWNTIFGS